MEKPANIGKVSIGSVRWRPYADKELKLLLLKDEGKDIFNYFKNGINVDTHILKYINFSRIYH